MDCWFPAIAGSSVKREVTPTARSIRLHFRLPVRLSIRAELRGDIGERYLLIFLDEMNPRNSFKEGG